jgi:hypothetical protein
MMSILKIKSARRKISNNSQWLKHKISQILPTSLTPALSPAFGGEGEGEGAISFENQNFGFVSDFDIRILGLRRKRWISHHGKDRF